MPPSRAVTPPPVGNRIVIAQSLNDTLPAVLNTSTSPPSSPVAASSPRRSPPHAAPHRSPDHRLLTSQVAQPIVADQRPLLPFTIDNVFNTSIPVLRHIPKAAQREMAALKNSLWNDILRTPDDIDAWTKAFAHTKLTLFLPPGKKSFRQKTAIVKQRIFHFREGRFDLLWREATRQPRTRKPEAVSQANNIR